MKRVDLIYFEAGGGHRAAVNALKLVFSQQNRPWDTQLVNLQELLDPIDIFHRLFRVRLQDLYNLLLRRGWTLGSSQLCTLMHAAIRTSHPLQVRLLDAHWQASRPDLVVSLIPNFNRALFESLRSVMPATPFVTILTDLADYPPHFWIERQDQFLICGSLRAVEQARAQGYPDERIFRTSGMILHPRFYEPVTAVRESERQRLGLDPARVTGLVLFGGEGSRAMLDIARSLDLSGLGIQLILICGRNTALTSQLKELRTTMPKFVEGFTAEIPYYMHLADFFVGKPGPGSISEALAMGLPVIVQRNAWTLPQERYNAEWVRRNKVGLVVRDIREIAKAVGRLIEPETLAKYRENAAAIRNQAVFEIPDILERIMTAPAPVAEAAGPTATGSRSQPG